MRSTGRGAAERSRDSRAGRSPDGFTVTIHSRIPPFAFCRRFARTAYHPVMSDAAGKTPAGWYDDGSGRQRYWDGQQWTVYAPEPAAPPFPPSAGRTANRMPVSYTRQQQGHSLTLWIILSLLFVIPVIWLIYFSVSPNHFWHA